MGIARFFLPRREQIPRSLFTRVNFIVRMWSNPCDAPFALYVETMWPAALEAAITAVDFGIADIARNIFRPWGLTGGRGLRQRRGRRPKLTRRIQRKFGPLKLLQDRKIGNGLKWLWIVDTKLQMVLLWFLIIDVLSEFLYLWTSGLYCTAPCLMSQGPGAALANTDGTVHLSLEGWSPLVFKVLKYKRGNVNIHFGGGTTGDGIFLLVCGGTARALTGGTLQISMRMRLPGNPTLVDTDGPVSVTTEDTADLLVSGIVEDPYNIAVDVRSEGGHFEILDYWFLILGQPPGGIPLCPS